MRDSIFGLLEVSPNLLGREIAKKIGKDRKEVNSFLNKNQDIFYQKKEYRWSNKQHKNEFVFEFQKGWLSANAFEKKLVEHPNLFILNGRIRFVFSDTKLLLDAIMRLLCLTNQLCHQGRIVCLDFTNCLDAFGYLDRLGFLKHLHSSVQLIPEKPEKSLLDIYKKGSDSLIEVFPICPEDIDNEDVLRISEVLKNSFNQHEKRILLPKLQMFVGSLIDNVRQHGYSELIGYSALQIYNIKSKNQKKIILVIADNGEGLITTLRKALGYERYHVLAKQFGNESVENNKKLLAHVLNNGGITQKEDQNRGGLGLNEAHSAISKISKYETVAQLDIKKIDVNVSIRLDDGLYDFLYEHNQLKSCDLAYKTEYTKIGGTQFILSIVLTM